ncbi:MAG: hypothetical protein KC657_05655 [Myxococcales bacterium]|nr:hypothetical protein [Myxococcales bacterium]
MSDPDAESRRKRLESLIPEIIKRAVERGVTRATEAPEELKQLVTDLRVPKEIVGYLFTQVDETKNGLFRVFAKEMRDFLEHTNLAGEIRNVLTTVQFEIHTTVRFAPNDTPSAKADASEADVPSAEADERATEAPAPRANKRRSKRGRSSHED